jgi:ubiquinone/menaquinone biosynthesis C-methylase UbiE
MAALEVAAGSGALTGALSRRAGSVLATDFSPEMVRLLRHRGRTEGWENVACAVMDGQALDVDDDRFDFVACTFALMLFPDRARGLSEFRRVLRPGGRVMVSGWATPERFEFFDVFLRAIKLTFPHLVQSGGPSPAFSLADLDDFRGQMQSAGFAGVEVGTVTRELSLSRTEDVWDILAVGTPTVQQIFDKIGADGKARLREALIGIVEREFGPSPFLFRNTATVGYGVA